MSRSATRFILTTLFVVLSTTSMGAAQESAVPAMAPLNPRFVEFMSARQLRPATSSATADGHGLGLIPSPLDFSRLRTQSKSSPKAADALPSSYDLRTYGRVTSVKDQGACEASWAFATLGSVESALAPGESRDFSENNLKNLHGYDYGPCQGGNANLSMAYLAGWAGPVNESDDPYQATDVNTSPPGLAPQKHLQDAILLPARAGSLDNDAIKSAVMTYGALYVSLYWDESAYDSTTASYYANSWDTVNRAMTLAGWDDNYNKANFKVAPPGDGAFLVKNSRGSGWGQSGYCWISYYDTSFATVQPSVAFAGNETVTNYARIYEYDPLGWVGGWGYPPDNTGWFANVFTAQATEDLKAVSTYVISNSSPYIVKVYTGVTGVPTSGTLALTTSGTFSLAGYHTVRLPTPVPLTSGQKFSVVVSLTTPGDEYPIPIEYAALGYSSSASASPGQSYISSTGSSWQDLTSLIDPEGVVNYTSASVALKAFAGKRRHGQIISQ